MEKEAISLWADGILLLIIKISFSCVKDIQETFAFGVGAGRTRLGNQSLQKYQFAI